MYCMIYAKYYEIYTYKEFFLSQDYIFAWLKLFFKEELFSSQKSLDGFVELSLEANRKKIATN